MNFTGVPLSVLFFSLAKRVSVLIMDGKKSIIHLFSELIMKNAVAALMCVIFICFSCGQWKVSTMKSSEVATIQAGREPGRILLKYDDNGMLELSFVITMHGGKIYFADNIQKRIQILDRDGSVNLILGSRGIESDSDILFSSFNFSTIGYLAIDSEEQIYVQNKLVSRRGLPESNQNAELDFTPSFILVFNSKGDLQYTLGQAGVPNIPFYYIKRMTVDNEDRLFVVSRTFNSWDVSRFKDRKRDFYIDLGRIRFKESEEGESFEGRIEDIIPYAGGEAFIIAVAYYSNTRFKYRKLFEFSIRKNKIHKTILNTPDPKNELFAVIDDKHIYLWDMRDRNIRYAICNFDGNVINNIMLKRDERKNLFSDALIDENGQFYTYHVYRGKITICEWK